MATTNINVLANGPILISGKAAYVDADGNQQTTQGTNIALCRCGQSEKKPFCDGSHKKVGFDSLGVELKLEA